MKIEILIENGKYRATYKNYDDAMFDLQRLKNNDCKMERENKLIRLIRNHQIDDLARIFAQCRCPKCVHEGFCSNVDIDGNCKEYKRDPPDGGYYG